MSIYSDCILYGTNKHIINVIINRYFIIVVFNLNIELFILCVWLTSSTFFFFFEIPPILFLIKHFLLF